MGYYNDDGTEVNPEDFPLPILCMSCIRRHREFEKIVCNLHRMGQEKGQKFECPDHVPITSEN